MVLTSWAPSWTTSELSSTTANAEQDETSAIAADGDDRNATDPVAQNKKRAAAAQAEAGEFSMDEVYMTLVDPYVRDKVELNAYATAADDKYLKGIYIDVKDAFMDDFIFWTGEHFKLLPKELSRSIRDCLLGNGASIRKESGFPIWKALGEYTDGLRRGEMVDTDDVPPKLNQPVVDGSVEARRYSRRKVDIRERRLSHFDADSRFSSVPAISVELRLTIQTSFSS